MTSNAQPLMMNPARQIRFATEDGAARLLPVTLVLVALITGALVVFSAPSPLRSFVVLIFLGVVPGLSIVNLFGLGDTLQKLVMSIGLSLALDTIVAVLAVYAGLWSPIGILSILIGITLMGAGLQLKFLAESGDAAAPALLWEAPALEQAEALRSETTAIASFGNGDASLSAAGEERNDPSVRLTRAVVLIGYLGVIGGWFMVIAMKIIRGIRA